MREGEEAAGGSALGLDVNVERDSPAPSLISDPVCPRCGYSLRGVAQWTDACPLTGTCSECGLEVEWRKAFTILPHPWLFERLWRIRPARSFVATASRTLRPWRLWNEVDLSEPFVPGAALVFNLLLCLLILCADVCLGVLTVFVQIGLSDYLAGGVRLRDVMDVLFSLAGALLRVMSIFGGLMALWSVVLTVCLLLLPTSLRRARVLPHHLMRIAFYSCPFVVFTCITGYGALYALALVVIQFTTSFITPWFAVPIAIMALITPPLSIILYYRWALRDYLKLPHSWWVSILLTLLAGLVTLALVAIVTVPLGYTDWVTWF